MSRVFWFALGAGSGVYAMVKTRRAAERLTPSGIADQVGAVGHGFRLFGEEVRSAMVERETRLRARLALTDAERSAPPAIAPASREGDD
jgi:Family of unknown function (DUF6167)